MTYELTLEELIAGLTDELKPIREEAKRLLPQMGEKAVEPLIQVLKLNEGIAWHIERAREDIVEVLTQIGTPAVESLTATLQYNDDTVRAFAAKALGDIGDKHAVDLLLNIVENSA